MARPRWIAPWKESTRKPAIYHVISRVVDRRKAFGAEEKERFRRLMRMTERFTGCRVLAYCVMSNHFHLLLEVPPAPAAGVPDSLVLSRMEAFYPRWKIDEIARRLEEARERGDSEEAERVLASLTYRMHDLSEFMKTLLQRFSSWFNRRHERTGRLWEQRFKSVIVEDGTAARVMAAYIDLNPVRAGICEDPADYRWSSYSEAIAGSRKARAGLARVWGSGENDGNSSRDWTGGGLARRYRAILLGQGKEVIVDGQLRRKGMRKERSRRELAELERHSRDLRISRAIRHRVRYFSDGAVLGGRAFVDEVFRGSRQFFSATRMDGARKPRGTLAELAGEIWSARDLRVGTG